MIGGLKTKCETGLLAALTSLLVYLISSTFGLTYLEQLKSNFTCYRNHSSAGTIS